MPRFSPNVVQLAVDQVARRRAVDERVGGREQEALGGARAARGAERAQLAQRAGAAGGLEVGALERALVDDRRGLADREALRDGHVDGLDDLGLGARDERVERGAVGHPAQQRVVAGPQLAAAARDGRVDLEERAGVDDPALLEQRADGPGVGARGHGDLDGALPVAVEGLEGRVERVQRHAEQHQREQRGEAAAAVAVAGAGARRAAGRRGPPRRRRATRAAGSAGGHRRHPTRRRGRGGLRPRHRVGRERLGVQRLRLGASGSESGSGSGSGTTGAGGRTAAAKVSAGGVAVGPSPPRWARRAARSAAAAARSSGVRSSVDRAKT